jgi:WD40 repeat protein
MKFSADEKSWVFSSTPAIQTDFKRKALHDVKKFIHKKSSVYIGNHTTGGRVELRHVKTLAISSDGVLTALAGRGDKAFLVNNKGGLIRTISYHLDKVVRAVFTPNGQILVTASKDGTILLTDVTTGETLAKQDCDTHKKLFFLGVTPDSEIIVSIWGDTVMRWQWAMGDLESYNLSAKRGREGRPIAMSDDCRFIACTNHEGVDIADAHSGKLLHIVKFQSGHVTAAAFTPDGSHLALGKAAGITSSTLMKSTLDIWQLVF